MVADKNRETPFGPLGYTRRMASRPAKKGARKKDSWLEKLDKIVENLKEKDWLEEEER